MSTLESPLNSTSHSASPLQTWTRWTTTNTHQVFGHVHSHLITDCTHLDLINPTNNISTLTTPGACPVCKHCPPLCYACQNKTTGFLETRRNVVPWALSYIFAHLVCVSEALPNQQQCVGKPHCIKKAVKQMDPPNVLYKCVPCSFVYAIIKDIR